MKKTVKKMSSSLDKKMMSISLEVEDLPFDLPNLPQFCSSERNTMSVIGRILNPECQNMSDLILDMPRKWQMYERVRGVALSKEKFQFIFKYEHDLEEILNKGVHTFNQWSLVMERWVEKPPPDYLQSIQVWVQLRNIPVNHYTLESITAFGEFAGRVVEVAYDPTKSQNKEYVRVRVRLDVSKPLRRSKVIILPSGDSVTIFYNYERVQKCCYTCQRLIHEQERCPIYLKNLQGEKNKDKPKTSAHFKTPQPILMEGDPLFGVLMEQQVGLDPHTGRQRMANDVLEGMRVYLLADTGEDRLVKEGRIKASIEDFANDPLGQKTLLRLEPAPLFSSDVNKGKGLVFNFDPEAKTKSQGDIGQKDQKLMSSAIRSGIAMSMLPSYSSTQSDCMAENGDWQISLFSGGPMVSRTCILNASSSGTSLKKMKKQRNRPTKKIRKLKGKIGESSGLVKELTKGAERGFIEKRKATEEEVNSIITAVRSKPKMVPNEGPSDI